jgi:hypothetical protein
MGRERLSKLRKDRSLTHDELTLSCSRPLRVNLLYEKFWCDVSIVLCNFFKSLTEWSETGPQDVDGVIARLNALNIESTKLGWDQFRDLNRSN